MFVRDSEDWKRFKMTNGQKIKKLSLNTQLEEDWKQRESFVPDCNLNFKMLTGIMSADEMKWSVKSSDLSGICRGIEEGTNGNKYLLLTFELWNLPLIEQDVAIFYLDI